jgi:hypothetical protein
METGRYSWILAAVSVSSNTIEPRADRVPDLWYTVRNRWVPKVNGLACFEVSLARHWSTESSSEFSLPNSIIKLGQTQCSLAGL